MDSGRTVINIRKQKINSKLNDNISIIEGKAIFSCFDLLVEFNIEAEKRLVKSHKVIPL